MGKIYDFFIFVGEPLPHSVVEEILIFQVDDCSQHIVKIKAYSFTRVTEEKRNYTNSLIMY